MSSSTLTSLLIGEGATDLQSPLFQVFSIFINAASSIWHLLISVITFLLPISIVLYALAPVIVFSQLLFNVLIFWPYKIITATLDAIYPLYVFVGVSCIVGALIGASGKYVALAAMTATMPPDDQVMVVTEKLVKEEESA